ncbi:MAG: hypothetical protein PWQ17_975 [Anaerophaga sp.]|nr:hypothetical protein [Anaerophaga sp.]
MQTLDWKPKDHAPSALLIGYDPRWSNPIPRWNMPCLQITILIKPSGTRHLKVNRLWFHPPLTK